MFVGKAVPLSGLQGSPYLQAVGISERFSVFCRSDPFEFVEKDYGERLDQGRCTAEPAVLVSLSQDMGLSPGKRKAPFVSAS